MKNIIIFVVVVAGAYFAWNNLPGLRDQVTKAANKYGGWTEEARKSDPVGFIEHAIKTLDNDVAEFTQSKADLVAAKKSNEAKLEEFRDEQATAAEFAASIKEQFKTANETDGWPITINGESYDKSQVITTVNNLLKTQAEAGARMVDYQGILTAIDTRASQLSSRIEDSKFNKEALIAKKEMVKVDNLSAETDALLAKVNDLVEGNQKLADEGPPMTLEGLTASKDKTAKVEETAAAKAAADSAALDFLNS